MIYVVIILCFIVVYLYWNIENKKRMKDRLRMEFGKVKGDYKSEDELDKISYYFDSKKTNYDLDAITWNDLSMNKIFNDMNVTSSNVGEEYLFALLHRLEYKKDVLEERERISKILEQNTELRVELQSIYHKLGKIYNHSVYETLENCRSIPKASLIPHYLICSSVIGSIPLIFINHMVGGIIFSVSLAISLLYYYYTKGRIKDSYQWSFKYFAKMLRAALGISKLHCTELEDYFLELKEIKHNFRGMSIKSVLLSSGIGFVADSIDFILDYVRLCTHIDIIIMYKFSFKIKKEFKKVERLYEILGMFESMIAVTSYKIQLPFYSRPILENGSDKKLLIKELYHPLVETPIANSIYEKGSILLTGSNASGKSTFLKAIAINAIFSQTIYISTSKSYHGNYFKIYTSMALSDNIMSRESYFIVEIKAIKRILDELNEEYPVLCCIDEVLRGTNTLERIAASSEILAQLSNNNAICIAATHDIELGAVLSSCFTNYHFNEKIIDDQITFNYKLYSGIASSRNAIKLLSMLGYRKDIVNKSNKRLDEYVKNGIWEPV